AAPGTASLTAATKTSPMPAYRRRVPPSTLMHSTSRAPELSATLSRLSCWIMSARPLQDFHDAPALQLRERTRLGQAHPVALTGVVRLVVRVEVARLLHGLAVARVPDPVDDRDDHRLVHLRGDHEPFPDLPGVRANFGLFVGHRLLLVLGLGGRDL